MTTDPTEVPLQPADIATMLIDELVAALINVRIYSPTHPRVQGSITGVQQHLRELGEATGDDTVCIGCAEDLLIYQHRRLLGASLAASRLVQLFGQWLAGGIELAVVSSHDDLMAFFAAVVARPRDGETYVGLNARLVQAQIRHLRLLPQYVAPDAGPKEGETNLRVAAGFYQRALDVLQDTTVEVCRGGRIDFGPVQALAEEVLNRLAADNGPLLSFARQDQYDAFTFGHSLRVAVLSMNFARSLTSDRALLIRIGTAALLHDVGKSLIAFEILHSPTALTPEQRSEMDRHAPLGAEVLLDHSDSDPLAIAAAFGHHRSPDGRGYPKTVHDHHTTMVTNIVKICDVYEALTGARPYKQPMTPIRAYRIMLTMVDRFDLALLRQFIACNGIFPVGQMVELDSGELAMVSAPGANRLTPVVELIVAADGTPLPDEECTVLDLGSIECCFARRCIVGEVDPARAASARDSHLAPV